MNRIVTFLAGLAIIATTATVQADITWATGAPGGTPGTSLSFDGDTTTGIGTFLDTGVPASALNDYTISLWLNQDNAVSDQWFIGHQQQGLHLGVFTPAATNDPATVRGLRHAHWGADTSGNTTVPAATWVHATFTYDADGGSFQTDTDGDGINDADPTGLAETFFNGVSDSGPVATPGTPVDKRQQNNQSGNIVIGTRFSNTNGGTGRQPWVGDLDDIAIWDSVISAADIALIAGGTDPTTLATAPGAYWNFEDDTTSTVASVQGALGSNLNGVTAVPEPTALAMILGLGLGALGFVRRKRN